MVLVDVAEQVIGLDEVVAGVHVSVVLHRERQSARLAVHAHSRGLAHEVRERRVEHLHVHVADVVPHPVLEDVDQEPAVALGRHRALGHLTAGLNVQRAIAPRGPAILAPALQPLDHRDELHEPCATVVAEEAVDLATAPFVGGVNGRQHVVFHAAGAEMAESAHHLIEAAVPALRHPEGVVDLARTVD